MQSGGGAQQGHDVHGRNPAMVGPTSSSASPSSSSSAMSTPLSRFDSIHQQQQQQQRQSLQQQLLRKPEGNEAILAYQSGLHGLMGGANFASSSAMMQLPQQPRKFNDLGQQQSIPHFQEGSQNRNLGIEQQMLTPVQQAYLQYAFQQKSNAGVHSQQQAKTGMAGSLSGKDHDERMNILKMQELMSGQAANQGSASSSSKKAPEHFAHSEKQAEQAVSDSKNDPKLSIQPSSLGQILQANAARSMQSPQVQQNTQFAMAAQMQAMQALAQERNIDLSLPANANLMAQLFPLMQSRMLAQHKANESNTGAQSPPVSMPAQVASPQVVRESSPRQNSSSNVSGQSGSTKARHPMMIGNGMPPMHPQPQQSSVNLNQGVEHSSNNTKSTLTGPDVLQMQNAWQSNRSSPQSRASPIDGGSVSSQGGVVLQMQQQRTGFTKQQLHVLKAQILAFRRLKKGDRTLPHELLQAISPPPLETQVQQTPHTAGKSNHDRSAGKNVDVGSRLLESNEKDSQVVASGALKNPNEEAFAGDEKTTSAVVCSQGMARVTKEPVPVSSSGKEEQKAAVLSIESGKETEHGNQKTPTTSDPSLDRGKAVAQQVAVSDNAQSKKPVQSSNVTQPKDVGSTRKYHGPLFDFPYFTRKHDSFGSSLMVNNNNLTLAYDVKDLLLEEGMEFHTKKREESLRKIGGLLAVNLERKRIRPDLVLRLQIEEKKLRLLDLQARLREEVDQQQQEIMAMPDRPYRKFVRLCERQRMELTRQVQASQKAMREKQLKSIFQWRKKLLEAHWTMRDARTARNRGVAKYHERMLREFSKRKDDDRNKRMEALKNNDVERYREMLLEQQTSIPGDAAERYAVLSSFLTQTEDYLQKLGGKITATKNQQEVEEAANNAAANARAQGLSEEEVRAAAACAREEVMIRNRFSEMNAPKDSSSVNKYYNLAHAVNERVTRQPSMLRAGTLRDYQLVGLQWMLSLYNNKLNGILADEMGLGKTVQVMALIAYLMEFKGNYGPHLIIVPNAVLVNWKSEFHNWLPSASCIFYVGAKDQRSKVFSQEVCAMKFNVLVTTYEFIMYDRSKLSKVDWKYVIIDEAQRMKDRESVLARDLDRYRCQRRLLLTGTPLQNDLKELWSLLNLLLPDVFDNRKAFHDWFSQPFQKEGPTHNAEDDWLETEKKVIIIHRLHQILEPFMLRRRVEDVEGSLPPKVSIVLRCRMSAIQGAIYDWIKSTGTIRVDPEDEKRRVQKNPIYQAKIYKPLNNRCMELRKVCNHPLLNYPYFNDLSKDFLVRSCGKLWVLDRILIKLQRTGHRVLLFSTMTKLLDILEEYLQWRRLVYRRIDGTTSLEDRESAIVDFNSPGTDCFIFLLSIRAAGRGLNLQTADTVVIYDPDPNPKNEEQAVARAHRIGQTREVKVIYMEAVVDKISSHQKEDEFISGGLVDSEDDLAGKDRYMGSIEGLIRNNIQQYKIDMADEVINAGRFDQRTTHEERRLTLETLLHDDERYQETVHDVPSLQEVNRMIARSEEEVELFDQMDEELDWEEEMMRYDQVPKWMRASTREVNSTISKLSKKPSKNTLLGGSISMEASEMGSDITEKRRGRPKGKKPPIYTELDDEDGEFSEASSEERNGYSAQEEGDLVEFEEDETSGAIGTPIVNKDQPEEDGPVSAGGYEYHHASQRTRNNHAVEDAGSGSSSDSRRLTQMVSPSMSSQKFGSLSALDSRPSSLSKKRPDELEEGEIGGSGDSHVDLQQSGSWIQDRDEGEDEQQVLQPKIKRKRSIRLRPRHTIERPDEKYPNEKPLVNHRDSSQLPSPVGHQYESQYRFDSEPKIPGELKYDQLDSSLKSKRNLPSRKIANPSKAHVSPKSSRLNSAYAPVEDAVLHSKESWDSKKVNTIGALIGGNKMSDVIQRRCKNVISKLQRRIDKEGPHIVPLLTDLWKRIESSGHLGGTTNSIQDLRKIDQRIERFEYNGVMELVSDVQFMLKSSMLYYGFSHEVRSEARKVHDLFFDILKIAFPDTDFREARTALSFSSPLATSTAAQPSRQAIPGQSKRHKLVNEVESDPIPPQKLSSRVSLASTEDTRARSHIPQKESRIGIATSSRDQPPHNDQRTLTHPGDLVICKKKRKDREKSIAKPGNGPVGPVSPPSISRSTRSTGPGSGSILKDTRSSQGWVNTPPQQQVNAGTGILGWANPVKRLRTDSGKRRPSHL